MKNEGALRRVNSAAAYSEVDRDFPQWPLVVTATMLQFPSNVAAMAGESQQTIAKAVDRAKAQIRLPIMEVLIRVVEGLQCENLHQMH